MKISTKGRYAIRMMLDTAENQSEGFVPLKDIAQRQNVSKKYLEQIALQLGQAGVLRATRGHQGGYMLVKPLSEYTVGDILRITEGSLVPVACMDQELNCCERRGECLTLPVWQGLHQVITNYVDGITLQDIVDGRVGDAEAPKP